MPVFFINQLEFRKWLEQNHDKETEIVVGFYKVNSKKHNMTWSQSVDQALCFGWIDGIRHSIDRESYCIRFTPRRTGSKWSTVNLKKAERLMQQNLMHPAGLKSFLNRKNGAENKVDQEYQHIKLPPDFEREFKAASEAWAFFQSQPPSYRITVFRWIMDAKQPATRQRRLVKAINESEAGRKIY